MWTLSYFTTKGVTNIHYRMCFCLINRDRRKIKHYGYDAWKSWYGGLARYEENYHEEERFAELRVRRRV